METTDYVSYPIALALKRAGFDWPCDHYYCAFDNETDVRFWSIHPAQSQNELRTPNDTVVADAPTLAHAQKWLREKGIEVNAIWSYEESAWFAYLSPMNRPQIMDADVSDTSYPTYEQALSEGIKSALELIKKGE